MQPYIQLAQQLGINLLPEDAAKVIAFGRQAYEAGVMAEREAGQRWFDAVTAQYKAQLQACQQKRTGEKQNDN